MSIFTKMDRKQYLKTYQENYKGKVKRVKLTFSLEEFGEVEALANSLDIKPSILIRRLALATIRGNKFLDTEAKQELRNLHYLVSNIANNVNQLARHSNTLKRVVDDNQVLLELKELNSLIQGYALTGKAK